MLDVFGGLPNVTDYHIMWSGLQPIPDSPVPFLTAVFQPNLRTLSLEISLENVESLLSPSYTIRNLEELALVLRIDHANSPPDYHVHILTHHLAPAISRLHSSLRKLSIRTWEALDLSPLFHAVKFLPSLSHVSLAIPIEAPHIGDPSGVTALLRRQRTTLYSLSLRATQYSGAGLTPDASSLDEWIHDAITGIHLPSLRELDLSSALFPFSASLACVDQFAGTITGLAITGRYHSYEDVREVLRAFTGRSVDERLEWLRLGTLTLTPQLVDLLAREMPQLDRLELLIREIVPHNDELMFECMSIRCQIVSFSVIIFLASYRYLLTKQDCPPTRNPIEYQIVNLILPSHFFKFLFKKDFYTGRILFGNGTTFICEMAASSFDDGVDVAALSITVRARV